MNIFYLSSDPIEAAQMQVDRHVVKMILETAQLLSTAHRLLDGTEYIDKRYVEGSFPPRYRNVKCWRLDDDINDQLMYQATHINHPSAIWCRQSNNNYNWLFYHFVGLMDEYHYRYGKSHACAKLTDCLQSPPKNIPIGPKTQPTPAMDAKYIVSKDSIENYRNYYIYGKAHLHKYTKRQVSDWLLEKTNMATYTFRDKKTGEIKDISMPMTEIVDFENNNTDLERVYHSVTVVDPVGIGVTRPPADFSKYVLGKVKAANPHTEIGNGRWGLKKEI